MRLFGSRTATALLAFASVPTTFAQDDEGADSLRYDDLRQQHPSLYTGDYGDCLGGESLFNITRYDTAYYRDGTALLFHLSGATNVREENVILHIGIDAYGENRLDLIVNPCSANISSLCPLEASNPVEAFAVNFLAPAEVANMSQIALDIPDFEGTATLRIFANSSQTEIGCFRAVMHNGRTFSHPYAVSSGLAGFTLLAIVSTFFTAIYGVSVPHIRTHHGHAFSVLLMLESFQTIFLSGALSVDWPSVLPAFRSNFSWSAGLIYSEAIVDSMAGFAGITGNASQVGGAGSAVIRTDGGLIQSIYGRSLQVITPSSELFRRAEAGFNATDPWPYSWHGHPVTPGLPMPGTWSAFPGTLVPSHIPSAGAFLLALLWWVLAICLAVVAITAVKLLLDFLAGFKLVSQDGFTFFRTHLFGYIGTGVLRTLFVASPPLLTLALLQFNLSAPTGPIAIAAVVFALLVLGLGGVVSYACYIRLRSGRYETGADQIVFEQGKLFNVIPFPAATRTSKIGEGETGSKKYGSMPFFRVNFVDEDPDRASVHQDEAYVKRFGWLTAHYRRTRWWFFSIWFSYQFIRACFLGGGSRSPLAQVYGLFVLEVLAFALFVKLKPYEGQRNAAVVWVLGVCKVVTAGFSIAFLPAFAISRILSTVLGIVIIVVQASLALIVLSLVAVGMVSSWMSVNRNREEFRPEGLDTLRIRYYEHLQNKAPDLPPTLKSGPGDSLVPNRTFSVNNVRRARKIEDEDGDFISQVEKPHAGSVVQFAPANRPSRANSASSRHSVGSLPRRARPHRASWSSKDLAEWDTQFDRPDSAMGNSIRAGQGSRQRSNSLRQQAHLNSASQTSLRINSDLYEQGHSRRPPLTPACEASEDQVMAMGRIEPNIAEENIDGTSSPPTKSMKDTEPFPALEEMNETKA